MKELRGERWAPPPVSFPDWGSRVLPLQPGRGSTMPSAKASGPHSLPWPASVSTQHPWQPGPAILLARLTLSATTLASNRLLRVIFNLSWVVFLSTWKWWNKVSAVEELLKDEWRDSGKSPLGSVCDRWPFPSQRRLAPHSRPLASFLQHLLPSLLLACRSPVTRSGTCVPGLCGFGYKRWQVPFFFSLQGGCLCSLKRLRLSVASLLLSVSLPLRGSLPVLPR